MRNFRKDEQGNFAAMGAIAALTLTVAVGGAIDFSHQNNVETSLQAVVDGAALAGARSAKNGDTLKQQKQIAKNHFLQTAISRVATRLLPPHMKMTARRSV